jgi:hypothetical protein
MLLFTTGMKKANSPRTKSKTSTSAMGFISELAYTLHREPLHALFLEVMAEKADQPCSTFLLPHCGQTIFPVSCSATVKIFENVFLQVWQKNS